MARDRGFLHVQMSQGGDQIHWDGSLCIKGSVFLDVAWGEHRLGFSMDLFTRSLTQISLMLLCVKSPNLAQ